MGHCVSQAAKPSQRLCFDAVVGFLPNAQSLSSSGMAAPRWRLEQVDAVANDLACPAELPSLFNTGLLP